MVSVCEVTTFIRHKPTCRRHKWPCGLFYHYIMVLRPTALSDVMPTAAAAATGRGVRRRCLCMHRGPRPRLRPATAAAAGPGWRGHRPQLRLSMRSMGFTASRATSGSTSTTGHSYFKALYSLSMVFIFM